MASSHAYSTVLEYVRYAKTAGLEAVAITDHGPDLDDGAHLWHFGNLKAIPRNIDGVTILRGAEANIIDDAGGIDLPEFILRGLDIIIASIHNVLFGPKTPEEHTKILLNIIDNPYVQILGHLGREPVEFDIDRVVKKAKECGKLIEINSASLGYGTRIKERCRLIAQSCKRHGAPVVVSTDSHICTTVGDAANSVALLREAGIDEALVMNTTLAKIQAFLDLGDLS